MIERVARAIARAQGLDCWFDGEPESVVSNYPGQTGKYRQRFYESARAAIEAMREPTENMITVGRIGVNGDTPYDRDCILVWHDMIDVVLK